MQLVLGNMIYFSKIFKVKEGKLEILRNWLTELNTTRREEAKATFPYEHVTREVFTLFEGVECWYVIAFNESEDSEVPGKSDPSIPINQQHNAIKKECLEPFSQNGEVVMDISL